MKILLVNYEYPTTTENCGGGGQVTQALRTALDEQGHDVMVVTDNSGQAPADYRVRGPRRGGHYATFPARALRSVAAYCRDWQPDVVHGHFTLPSSLLLPAVSRRYDVPYVVTAMGADVYDPSRYQHLRPILDRLNRVVYRDAAAVTVPSRDLLGRLPAGVQATADVIPYGITPENWDWQDRTSVGQHRVLTVARLVDRKRLDRGITAVQQLRAAGHDVTYTIVGTGPLEADLRARADNCDWLDVRGYVDDLQAVFDDHTVFLLPSDHEAFGMVVLEALAAGLPVVATETGGHHELVATPTDSRRPVGATAAPNAGAVAAALQRVVDDYDCRQANTREYVGEYYARERMRDDFLAVYRRACADTAVVGV